MDLRSRLSVQPTGGLSLRHPTLVAVLAAPLAIAACDPAGSPQEPDAAVEPTPDAATPPPDAAMTSPDAAQPPPDAAQPTMVPVTMSVDVLLANGYPNQLHPLFRADLASGSALARMGLVARFCEDAACETPLAIVPVTIPGADANGRYVFSSANTSGVGFAKTVSIASAPLGASYLQLVGTTELSAAWGGCTTAADCPGDFDVVTSDGFLVAANNDGSVAQPGAASVAISVPSAGATVTVSATQYLGHLHFERGPLTTPAPADTGTLVAAVSNPDNTFRNRIALVDLALANNGADAVAASSYLLQVDGGPFQGDVCGFIPGGDSLYAIGISNAGASVFRLDATTAQQASTTPVVTIPPDGSGNYPHPCRGTWATVGGKQHLYLLEWAGAGALNTSRPAPIYDVNLTDASYATPIIDTDLALRGLVRTSAGTLVGLDMSWSKDSLDLGPGGFNRLVEFTLDGTGALGASFTFHATDVRSDEQCGATNKWPGTLAVATIGGTERLLVGHDRGVATYSVDYAKVADLSLAPFGQNITQLAPTPDGSRLMALPQCKSLGADSPFTLPYGATTEVSDSNRVAVLDPTGPALAVATTTLDVDGVDGPEHGVDLDFYRLKAFIRDHGATLPIPPVVYTGPQMVVGASVIVVRGTGIQGNGTTSISSSGLGQVQDLGFFDRATGHGVVFGDYVPWTDGLSSMAGTGAAIWGFDLYPGRESSVGAIHYIP
jgi:hypothetical protein